VVGVARASRTATRAEFAQWAQAGHKEPPGVTTFSSAWPTLDFQENYQDEEESDMRNAKGKHRKEQDLLKRARAYLGLLSASLLSATELLELVEAIRKAIH
jgi:hypothetical protein